MPKKCIICGEEALFCIKDSSEFYCEECAKEQFADISYLHEIGFTLSNNGKEMLLNKSKYTITVDQGNQKNIDYPGAEVVLSGNTTHVSLDRYQNGFKLIVKSLGEKDVVLTAIKK